MTRCCAVIVSALDGHVLGFQKLIACMKGSWVGVQDFYLRYFPCYFNNCLLRFLIMVDLFLMIVVTVEIGNRK